MFRVLIPGDPVPQGRGRIVRIKGFARIADPSRSRNWKAMAQWHMAKAMSDAQIRAPLQGPLEVTIEAVLRCPKTDHRKRAPQPRRWHQGRLDSDNLAKSALDAGNAVLWMDDGQVAVLRVRKIIGRQGEAPHLLMLVRELPAVPHDEGTPKECSCKERPGGYCPAHGSPP